MSWYTSSQNLNIQLYRGLSAYNKSSGSGYFTTEKEWARQFTQSGRDSEIMTATISADRIYRQDPLPQAVDQDQVDETVATAKSKGFAALWVDEGVGEPNSVLVIDRSVLKRSR